MVLVDTYTGHTTNRGASFDGEYLTDRNPFYFFANKRASDTLTI